MTIIYSSSGMCKIETRYCQLSKTQNYLQIHQKFGHVTFVKKVDRID